MSTTKQQLIPQLRFPEFQGEWVNMKLGNLGMFKGGGTPSTSNSDYWSGSIPWVSSSDVQEGDIINVNISRYISPEAIEDSAAKLIPKDSILFVSRVGVGKLFISKVDLCTSQDFSNLIPQNSNSYYVGYYFLANNKLLYSYAQGTSIKGFTTGDLKSIPINVPQLEEQQKIASFLTDVDTKITQLTKKAALLEQYKKGIMQKIFNQELRFNNVEGNAFPDWEEKKLGSIGSIVSGLTYSPNDINENGVLVLRSSNVKKRLISLNDNVFVNVEEGKYNPVELNDILICVRNGSKRLIGKNAIIKEEHIGLAFGAFMTVYRSKYNQFLFHFFDSKYYKKEVHKNLGATINSINGSDLKKFKVPFPCIEEQTKIANFLSAIDKKIAIVNNQIENTKAFKKGLLQKMFV